MNFLQPRSISCCQWHGMNSLGSDGASPFVHPQSSPQHAREKRFHGAGSGRKVRAGVQGSCWYSLSSRVVLVFRTYYCGLISLSSTRESWELYLAFSSPLIFSMSGVFCCADANSGYHLQLFAEEITFKSAKREKVHALKCQPCLLDFFFLLPTVSFLAASIPPPIKKKTKKTVHLQVFKSA